VTQTKLTNQSIPSLAHRVGDALQQLAGKAKPDEVAAAKGLVREARNAREYDLMGTLAEAVRRRDPKDATNRRLYAQYLIDTGKVTAAIDVLRPLQRLPAGHAERHEVAGLIGRAHKQLFIDNGEKRSAEARESLKRAVDAYRKPYEEDPRRNTWHGVNLVALLTRAKRLKLRTAADLNPEAIAHTVIADLWACPSDRRDDWWLPSLAEATLALGDLSKVEEILRQYVDVEARTPAFVLASTLRQFSEVWDLEQRGPREQALVDMLRARVAKAPDGGVDLSTAEIHGLQSRDAPDADHLQAVLGPGGLATFEWWKTGLNRSLSVASIRQKLGIRRGTGFLVRAGDVGLEPAAELVLLTNFHVVNAEGISPGIKPGDAEITFEAANPPQRFDAKGILWTSPVAELDATVLRLSGSVDGLSPLPMEANLPLLPTPPERAAVYVIGHPAGGDLSFSFRGNDLLDHEGPPAGTPPDAARLRVHYTATTQVGSSGSPVFDASLWKVIALHHSGKDNDMPMLNGRTGRYAANEGIAIASIIARKK
jgi:hypothetical protein